MIGPSGFMQNRKNPETEKYDSSVMELAEKVGQKLHIYSQSGIVKIADWLVHDGGDTGRPVSWLAKQYRATH